MSAESSKAAFLTLDDAVNLPHNGVNPYHLKDLKRRVSVARVGGKLYTFDDIYERYPLSGELLTGTTLMSQCHGSQFDVNNGTVLRGPAKEALGMYELRELDGKIPVRI